MSDLDGKRIAVVDDDPLFLGQITNMLQNYGGMNTFAAANGDALFKILDEEDISCILVDNTLEGETGLALGQAIKSRYLTAPPIILLTGSGNERTVQKAFRIGFNDYISKRDLDKKELFWAISTAITNRSDELAARAETERLRAQRRTDSLTGFASTSFTTGRLHELAATRNKEGFSIVTIIMNHLDDYRLQFGHSTGERIFRDFANNLSNADLQGGYLGHLNAHKLACIFEETTPHETLEQVARDLEKAATFDISVDGVSFQISSTTAHASFPDDGTTAEEVTNVALAAAMTKEAQSTPLSGKELPNSHHHVPLSEAAPQEDRRNYESSVATERREGQRRSEIRHRVLKRGKIVVNGLASVVDCVVRNISTSGVQIRVEGYFSPPTRFQLQIVEEGSQPRWVEKRWQVGNDIGLKFTETPQ